MNKMTINAGDSVSPEFLNAIQNLSFEKNQDEVGHLPLPPGYSDAVSQFKSFFANASFDDSVESVSIDMGNWGDAASVVVTPYIGIDFHHTAKKINITKKFSSGPLFIIPIWGNDYNGVINITVVTVDSDTDEKKFNLRKGQFAIVENYWYETSPATHVKIVPDNDLNVDSIYLDNSGKISTDVINDNDKNWFTIRTDGIRFHKAGDGAVSNDFYLKRTATGHWIVENTLLTDTVFEAPYIDDGVQSLTLYDETYGNGRICNNIVRYPYNSSGTVSDQGFIINGIRDLGTELRICNFGSENLYITYNTNVGGNTTSKSFTLAANTCKKFLCIPDGSSNSYSSLYMPID